MDFHRVEPVWRELEREGVHHPFQSMDWLRCWQECVGDAAGLRPLVVVVEGPDSKPWMILPFGLRRRGWFTALVWLGGDISDYHGPIVSPACPARWLEGPGFRTLWNEVRRVLPSYDYLHLDRQLPEMGGRPNPFLALSARRASSSAHLTVLGPRWSDY